LALLAKNVSLTRRPRILNFYQLLGTAWEALRVANSNDYFNGKSALEVISEAEDGLEKVQQYLKHEFQDLEEGPV